MRSFSVSPSTYSIAMHQLDRDLALEDGVEGAVDRGHAAVPDLCVEPVTAGEERAHV